MAQSYADEHGYELDTSLDLHDKGISAFKGANRAKGRLSEFLRMVEEGQIRPGSVLFIEALDRYSRSNPFEVLVELFTRLISNGITLVTGSNNTVYDKDSFQGVKALATGVTMLNELGVSNRESAQKSKRLKSAHKQKRKLSQDNGAIYSRRGPFWVTFNSKTNKFELNKHSKLVKLVFELFLSGLGTYRIQRYLSEKNIKTINGNYFQPSIIRRLLRDRKVLGEFQLGFNVDGRNTKSIKEGPPIKDYYPKCIDYEDFAEVQKIMDTRKFGSGSNSSVFIDLFERIIICGNTGINLRKRQSGTNNTTRYYARFRNGLFKGFTSWKCEHVEKCFLYLSSRFDFESISKYETKKSNNDIINSKRLEIDRLGIEINNWKNAISIGGEIEDFVIEYQKAKEKQNKLVTELNNLTGEYKDSKNTIINKKGVLYYYNLYLKRDESEKNRLIVRRIIKEEVKNVLLYPDGIKTDLFLNKDQKHLLGIELPVIGIISRNHHYSCFLAFRSRNGEPEPIAINGSISKNNTLDLIGEANSRIIA